MYSRLFREARHELPCGSRLMSSVPASLQESLADRYRLERELGQGGMATVYLAHDLRHDRDVALKVLRPELAAILGRERFLAEIRLTAKLDHPHILTLLDSGESNGLLWYTLPFIRGESLRQKLTRERQLGVAEAVGIARQIAGALDYAHQHGVIHRDVKPENILLHEGEAMLADFGIALAVREAGGPRLTETGLSIGTPQYMSPEQATAERQLDARSDVYSLGAVLYEMLAGEPPFTGVTGQAVIAKLMVERPTSLRTVRDAVPAGLDAVVLQALAKVPADRFPSAGAFAEALAAPGAHRAPRQVPKRALLMAGLAIAAVVAVAVWLVPRMRSGAPRGAGTDPTLTQITFTGNAVGPAISPDGKQLAYGLQTCRTPTDCGDALVIEDLASGERRTMPGRFDGGGMYKMTWSPDQRLLLADGYRAGQDGLHLASLFSGEVRYLGKYAVGEFLGRSDTIIARRDEEVYSSTRLATRWFLVMSAEGAVLDSIPFQVAGAWPSPIPSPDGRRILIWSYSRPDSWMGQSMYLIDRQGRLTDSLPTLSGFHAHQGLQWSPSGDGVLVMVAEDPATPTVWTLLRFPVSGEGKVRVPPDTVARRLRLPMILQWRIAFSPPSRTGVIAVELGERTHSIATLTRPSVAASPVRKGLLLSATGELDALISPDGQRVLVTRYAPLAGQPTSQLEVWPFEGGEGTTVGPPRPIGGSEGPIGGMDWSSDSRTIYRLRQWSQAGVPGTRHLRRGERSGPGRPERVRHRRVVLRASRRLAAVCVEGTTAHPRVLRTISPSGDSVMTFSVPDSTPWVNA